MTKFNFIKELGEAKLFKNPTKLPTVGISSIADSFFNAVLGLQVLKHTNPDAARRYAVNTLQYNNLSGWRSSGSDLHNMAHILLNPHQYDNKIKFDRSVSLPQLQLKTYLANLARGKDDPNFDRKFLLNLQRQLNIGSSGLRSSRRLVADWDRALPSEKKLAATRIYLGLQHNLNKSDLWTPVSRGLKSQGLLIKDAEIKEPGMPLWKKMAVAGVAGYALGRALSSL